MRPRLDAFIGMLLRGDFGEGADDIVKASVFSAESLHAMNRSDLIPIRAALLDFFGEGDRDL